MIHASILILLIRALIFRQDYRINRIMVWKMNKIPPSPDRAKGNQALCSRCLGGRIKNQVNPVIPSENILVCNSLAH